MLFNDFAALDPIEGVDVASAAMVGSGVRLWFVVQSLAQLRGRYPGGWQAFIANAGEMTFWSNCDPATLDFMSERVGMTGQALNRLLERRTQRCLILAAGQAPVILQRHHAAEYHTGKQML